MLKINDINDFLKDLFTFHAVSIFDKDKVIIVMSDKVKHIIINDINNIFITDDFVELIKQLKKYENHQYKVIHKEW